MSWLFSQALVEEYLAGNFLDGEQSALSNGNHTQQAYCAPDKMMVFSRISQFGMTYKPLTETRGEELLTLYLEAFHAKTLAQQEKAQESMEKEVECGEKWHGLLARFDQDTHSWRTVQCSLLEDLNECLQTFPQWGMTVSGELYLLPTLVQTTNEKESGLWLTPSTVDIPIRSAESMEKRLDYRKKIGRNGVGAGCLSEQVEWSGTGSPIGYITKETWPTPVSSPSVVSQTVGSTISLLNSRDREQGTLMEAVVKKMFPTPQASDNRDRGNMSNPSIQRRVAKGKQIMLSQSVDQNSGQLNPTWVEWLMGWPLGWTDLKPLVMDKSHSAQQQHGES